MLNRSAIIGSVVAAGVFAGLAPLRDAPAHTTQPMVMPGLQTGPAPWVAETPNLRARLRLIGLPALPAEGQVLHIHQHLDVFVDGKPVQVPQGIGINAFERFISPLHTHDTSGIMHVESTELRDFTLGQFFDVWGLRLSKDCLGAYCAGAGKTLRVFSNGKAVADPRALVLTQHQEIAVVFGAASTAPTVPAKFDFPGVY